MNRKFVRYLLGIIVLLGAFLRLRYLLASDFPLNDGGMFYTMTLDLIKNDFRLPADTTYNLSHIPYTYPPLALYLTGALHQFLGFDLLQLFRFLPFTFNLATIPIVYLLAREIAGDEGKGLLATFFWSVSAPSYQSYIAGGGLTRSPANFFSLCCLYFVYRYLHGGKRSHWGLGLLFLTLTLFTHVEMLWVTCVTIVVFWAFSEHPALPAHTRAHNFFSLLGMGACALLIAAPYGWRLISTHGLAPIVAGFSSGGFNPLVSIGNLFLFHFFEEFEFTLIAVCAALAILYQLHRREHFLTAWFLLLVFLDPRSMNRSVLLPLSILAAIAVIDLIMPLFRSAPHSAGAPVGQQRFGADFGVLAILVSWVFLLSALRFYQDNSKNQAVPAEDRAAMRWVAEHTPADASFLVVSQADWWFQDRVAEWFPSLTGRQSVVTVQGSEWLTGDQRYEAAQLRYNLAKVCLYYGAGCLTDWIEQVGKRVDFVYVSLEPCSDTQKFCTRSLANELSYLPQYQPVYRNDGAVIYRYTSERTTAH